MTRVVFTAGLLIVIGIGAYVYAVNDQISDVENVCSLFPEGADAGDLIEIESNYFVKLMGPIDVQARRTTGNLLRGPDHV